MKYPFGFFFQKIPWIIKIGKTTKKNNKLETKLYWNNNNKHMKYVAITKQV